MNCSSRTDNKESNLVVLNDPISRSYTNAIGLTSAGCNAFTV